MRNRTPINDDRRALEVAALPTEHSDTQVSLLFRRGYDRYVVDGEHQSDEVISDIERFGIAAFNEKLRKAPGQQPFVDDPGILAVVATLSAICVKHHPTFEMVPSRNIQVLYDIRELFVNNLASLLRTAGDATVLQDIAEFLYAKEAGPDGPHPGRVCTGITRHPEFGGGVYLEIPMVAASRACLVRADEQSEESDSEVEEADVEEEQLAFLTRVRNNHLYVPIGDFDRKYTEYARTGFKRLLQAQEEELTSEQITWLTTHETAISDRIESFLNSGHRERVWRNWDVGERLIRVLKKAIEQYPEDDVEVGEFLSASEIFRAIEAYDPDHRWEIATVRRISSPRSLGNLLSKHSEHRLLDIKRVGIANEYRLLEYPSTSSEPLDVDSIEDLFQLPCLANMDERLKRESPVRKDLFNFVRMVAWLPQYRGRPSGRILRDIKAVFSRWPWYNEQTTEYQVRYELEQTIDGETPLPMSCSNDDLQRYCIGQDRCPYSIYGSLPFPDEMYDRLGEVNNEEF